MKNNSFIKLLDYSLFRDFLIGLKSIVEQEKEALDKLDNDLIQAKTSFENQGFSKWIVASDLVKCAKIASKLETVQIDPYHGSAWASDAIEYFNGENEEYVKSKTQMKVVVVEEDIGKVGELFVDLVTGRDEEELQIFPNAEMMSFTEIQEELKMSLCKGLHYAKQALSLEVLPKNLNIRWGVISMDGEPFNKLAGESFGAAFSLLVYTLLQEYANIKINDD